MCTSRRQMLITTAALTLLACSIVPAMARQAAPTLPADLRTLSAPPDPATLEAALAEADTHAWITVTEEGRSAGNRPIRLVHLDRSAGRATWRVLLVAGQHGNEPAGVAALTFLVRDIAATPERLPADVDLWVIPVLNPDGYAANRRTNDAGADLNRDHILLAQPETRVLHDIARRVQPDVAVDLHEFDRTSEDYTTRGWTEWPDIMMDTANTALLDPGLYAVGVRWVEAMSAPLTAAGINYTRYTVGGAPPNGEQRPSTLEADDARNSLAATTGCLGFIVESGVRRAAADPNADLGRRVDAHLRIIRVLLEDQSLRGLSREAVTAARAAALPPFLPTNTFWGNAGPQVSQVKVIDSARSSNQVVTTANLMHDRIVKASVSTPVAWVVTAAAAEPYRTLLDRHGISYQVLGSATVLRAERTRLERVEEDTDPVYQRYGGRQIVTRDAPTDRRFETGALLVFPDQPARTMAALLLEPTMLYGLYQYPDFRSMVAADGTIPVWRVVGAGAGT